MHNLGIAVDVHSAGEPKRLNWLIANVKDFGFSWEVVPSEPWHLRYVCGDTPPPAVVAFGGEAAPAPFAKASTPASAPADENSAIQQALKNKGFYNGAIDGNIASAEFQQALKSFKEKNGLKPDFIIGGQVKKLLGLP